DSGPLTLLNTTVVDNHADDASGIGGLVLGRASAQSNVDLTLTNTIVAGNTVAGSGTASQADCGVGGSGAGPTSNGHNLTGAGTGCPTSGPDDATTAPGTVFTSVLGALADH